MTHPDFSDAKLLSTLEALDAAAMDSLAFGVIGFDAAGHIAVYNRFEAKCTGLDQARQIGKDLFGEVAQCMNNFMVAQRFEDALAGGQAMDVTMDYVLTWRMKPTKVQLRLLADPSSALRYIALAWR
ncbi:MAG: PAS domain-containing protein [Hylemonella sp.]